MLVAWCRLSGLREMLLNSWQIASSPSFASPDRLLLAGIESFKRPEPPSGSDCLRK